MKRVPWIDRDLPRLSRRTFLKGSGAAVALPFLEAMWPARAQAAPATARRFVAWYVPNGIHMPDWTPATTGASCRTQSRFMTMWIRPPWSQPAEKIDHQWP